MILKITSCSLLNSKNEALSAVDVKRAWPDFNESLPFGHYKLQQQQQHGEQIAPIIIYRRNKKRCHHDDEEEEYELVHQRLINLEPSNSIVISDDDDVTLDDAEMVQMAKRLKRLKDDTTMWENEIEDALLLQACYDAEDEDALLLQACYDAEKVIDIIDLTLDD